MVKKCLNLQKVLKSASCADLGAHNRNIFFMHMQKKFISQFRCQQTMLKVVQHRCLCRSGEFVCRMQITAPSPRAVGLWAANRHHWEPSGEKVYFSSPLCVTLLHDCVSQQKLEGIAPCCLHEYFMQGAGGHHKYLWWMFYSNSTWEEWELSFVYKSVTPCEKGKNLSS